MNEIKSVPTIAGGGGSSLSAVRCRERVDLCKSKYVSKLVSKEENKENMRAIARQNCHPELDSGSIQRHRKNATLVRFRLGGRNDKMEMTRACGFTMAEILLSLTIIGVVAAITLPSLTGNINERTWNTQRKALYARMSQAIALMPALNGYGTTAENAAETFIISGLAKVLKINNICGKDNLTDCGFPAKILKLSGNSSIELENIKTLSEFNRAFDFEDAFGMSYHQQLITYAAAFETSNGESILTYYAPNCRNDDSSHFVIRKAQPFMCANFVYDLNGSKGPNTVGKDIGFISVLYPSDSVAVAPVPVAGPVLSGIAFNDVASVCRNNDPQTRVPNYEELASMFYNRELLGFKDVDYVDIWSSKRVEGQANEGWLLKFRTGTYVNWARPANGKCIKR